jgi:cobalt-zinc-cadmium efflux system membrane fusion protein
MMPRRLLVIAALAGVGVLVAGCKSEAPVDAPAGPRINGERIVFPPKSPQLGTLTLASATERQGTMLRLTGRMVWDEERTVRIYTPFAGRIESIQAKVGDPVRANSILATVSSPDFGQTQAELHKAEVDFGLAEKSLVRQRELLEHGVAAAKDVQSAEADRERARAELARVRSRAQLYGGGGVDQRFPLRTPLSGVVVEKNINPGQEVRPDQLTSNMPPLFVVTDPNRLWVHLDAAERDLNSLRVGQTIALRTRAYPDETFSARIESIADFIDPTTRAIKVRASVDNSARKLKGEMFVIAEIKDESRKALTIPAESALLVGAKHYVFVARGDGAFDRIEVDVGREVDGSVTVRSGVGAGQRVVSSGALLLEQLMENGAGEKS